MTNETSRCLAAPEILSYLDGTLAGHRRDEIDSHLDECRLCGAAVEGVAGLEWREGFLRSTDRLLARIRVRTAQAVTTAAPAHRRAPHFAGAPQYLTLAATLLVTVGAAILLSRPGPGETLFQKTFEPYPSTKPIVRGGVTPTDADALALYEAGDYARALAAFDRRLGSAPEDSEARFYAGLCHLALGQDREAALDLEQVLRLGSTQLQAPAEWYLALAQLRGKSPADARPYLERIALGDGFYKEKARALVSELERLEGRD